MLDSFGERSDSPNNGNKSVVQMFSLDDTEVPHISFNWVYRSACLLSNFFIQSQQENAQLMKNVGEKSKLLEVYEEEVEKLKIALQGTRQQNCQLAETNSQMLAELNLGKDRGKPVDLAADASIGGKRKKTDIQITGQVHQEAPRRKLDDRKPIRRQSIAKAHIISSSNVQSVKAASCSGSGVSLHEEGRRSTRRTSIIANSRVHTEEATDDDSSKLEDRGVNTDVHMIIPTCAIKAEPETDLEITKPLLTQVVHQEAPRQKLGDSSLSTGDALDGPHPSEVPVATAPLTAQVVCQEAPRQKLGDRKSIRRRSIATVHAVSSSHVQSVKTASCSGSNVPLHEEGRKSTRRRSIIPSSGTQMVEAGTDSCKTAEHKNANTECNDIIPICTVNSEPNTEHGTRWLSIKEENTDVSDCSRVGTDATSGPKLSLVAARRSSLSRPLPLRRAVEKVGSYREQPVNVKMRRVD
ncbi:shugoshin-1-like isoform X1 [Carex littledalei]|uniref:Shugoshin-1-like isoform X1 n=1 Tax=Carex littledalei TaxID=544730 RepID=A0A833VPF8_9POAL|nr:shugoshin-1-like isoform X1 [Carex littledalei]